MTDDEIIKALECIASKEDVLCKNCSYNKYRLMECHRQAAKDALDLINRQKAEILRLQNLVELLELEKQMMQKASDKSKATAIGVIKRLDAEIARLTNERATAEPTDGK